MHLLLFVIGLLASGCATSQAGRLITPDQAVWIEKGVTTRAEVVAKFGSPRFEVPIYSPASFSTKTTTSTTTQNDGTTRVTNTTTEIQHLPRHTKATYLYTRADAAVMPFYANVQTQQSQFWVEYDEKGVVRDFGFIGDAVGSSR